MSEETEPSIGAQLRARRIELGQPLSEFAAKTRIRQIYLEALEEDRYEAFPGEAYLTGFLKGYASELGLDPDEMVAHYRARFGGEPGELAEGILPAATVVVPARGPSPPPGALPSSRTPRRGASLAGLHEALEPPERGAGPPPGSAVGSPRLGPGPGRTRSPT